MPNHSIYVGRQPILDTDDSIFGYELLFRNYNGGMHGGISDLEATANVIVNTLNFFGVKRILSDKVGFLNCSEEVLFDEAITVIPASSFILEILETVEITDEVIERVKMLKKRGYRFALDDFVVSAEEIQECKALFPHLDYLKIDLLESDEEQLKRYVPRLKKLGLKLLAEKVETEAMHQSCLEMGFELFQGYFFSEPVVLEQGRSDPSTTRITELIDALSGMDVDRKKVESIFRISPELTVALLRYLNSGALAMKSEIRTIQHAISLLGERKLLNWVMMLAYSVNASERNPLNQPLVQLVLTRAKLMELLTFESRTKQPDFMEERAFMCGMLSLMDVCFSRPLEELLEDFNVSKDICSALLENAGFLGELLELAMILEKDDIVSVPEYAMRLKLDIEDIVDAKIEALQWVETIREEFEF